MLIKLPVVVPKRGGGWTTTEVMMNVGPSTPLSIQEMQPWLLDLAEKRVAAGEASTDCAGISKSGARTRIETGVDVIFWSILEPSEVEEIVEAAIQEERAWLSGSRTSWGATKMAGKTITTSPADLCPDVPDGYSDLAAIACAEHAIAVYEKPDESGLPIYYRQEALKAGFQVAIMISRKTAQCGIAGHPDVIVIALRGSSQPGDFRDALASVVKVGWRPVLPAGIRIGRGFRRQAKLLSTPLLRELRQMTGAFPQARVVVTGHSLGGALVPLGVELARHHGIVASMAYSFESPRVGSRLWANWWAVHCALTPVFRVCNTRRGELDLVTRVPKRSWGFGHVGKPIIHDRGQVAFGLPEWRAFRDAQPVGNLPAWRILSKLASSIEAHGGQELLETLRARAADGNEGTTTAVHRVRQSYKPGELAAQLRGGA